MEQQERNIQPIISQEHCDAIPPMFSRELNWSEGFPNMVLSTEYSEAVNARYTFQLLSKTLGCHIKAYENSQLKKLIEFVLGKQIVVIEYLTM